MNAVAYARFSSDNQREESIVAQLRVIRDYADRLGVTIQREYIDEARSATTDDRPHFLQMIDDISSGRIQADYVYVHKLDRFSRNRYDSAIYRQKLSSKGVRLVAVTQPLDDSPESMILEAMLEAMAEYYSRNLGREVMKGMRETAFQGKHTGGKPPLGYNIDPETKKYVINEREAAAVKLIFERVSQGVGYGKVLDELNSLGYKTKAGNAFGKNSIYDILRNEKYSGVYVFNLSATSKNGKRNNHAVKCQDDIIRIPGEIPAIVPRDLWEEVQAKMDNRKQLAPRRRGDNNYILTGKVFCGECEAAYVGQSKQAGRNKTVYASYICSDRKRTKQCNNRDIRKEILENYVLDVIEEAFCSEEKITALFNKISDYYRTKYARISEERDQLQQAIKEITVRMDNLFDGIETGSMDHRIVGPRLTTLTDEKNALHEALAAIEAQVDVPLNEDKITAFLLMNRNTVVDRKDLEACRRLVEMYVEKITIFSDRIDVILNVLVDVYNTGGGGGNRTPVRK